MAGTNDKPDEPLEDDTHGPSGAPTDDAHRAAGDGTLQGSVPAGGLSDAEDEGESESAQPGTG